MKILIGYDRSTKAENAVQDLARAGLPAEAEVILLSVIPPMLPLDMLTPEGYSPVWYSSAYNEALKSSHEIEKQIKIKGHLASKILKKCFPKWKVTFEVATDQPSHAILKRAEEWKPDLIVLGSHGWNSVGKMLLGSTAEKVLTHADVSVRLGKGEAKEKVAPPRILIGFDGSNESRAAVEEVADRSWPKGTRVKLLAISDFQIRLDLLSMSLKKTKAANIASFSPWPWMDKKLALAVEKLEESELEVESEIVVGDPRHVLLEAAKKFKADSIFMGNRGLSGFKRFMLGSVSAAVASHSPCSIEIIRKGQGKKKK